MGLRRVLGMGDGVLGQRKGGETREKRKNNGRRGRESGRGGKGGEEKCEVVVR